MMLLTGCQKQKKNSKLLEIDSEVYLCRVVPNITGYTSPSGENPYTHKKVVVLNREFLECGKLKTEKLELVLKTTYLGAIKRHD